MSLEHCAQETDKETRANMSETKTPTIPAKFMQKLAGLKGKQARFILRVGVDGFVCAVCAQLYALNL